ncbi:MAG: LLM class flavin-dependent oxidoreductase [Dehalococcoidia bacterium]|jgi:alkanesulfonate monooxygenase SsuD/methylene tetrahydromethanopterin reductase-like flavin-dependent oxidoreductase (luciferase family)|nr:LLM class flavin-dependent oxidoreductase [Dehalococcoidia bacterium]
MAHRISISLPWDPRDAEEIFERARNADEAGVDTIWMNEGFGHDAFSGLTLLATETSNARIGTAIVNAYSRTPGALAQHFATIDQLSEGRVTIGLGSSGPGVIERFHGMPFQPAIGRLREVVELIRAIWRHERVTHHGQWYDIERALVMGVDPVQEEPPIYLATLHPNSVRMTAELADGWLPAWLPFDRLASEIAQLREWAVAAGREPDAVTVRSPSSVTVCEDRERADAIRQGQRQGLAFFVARNGDFYYRQFGRHGFADEAAAIKRAWDDGGAPAGIAAVPDELPASFNFVGGVEASIERLDWEAEAGVDLHQVTIVGDDARAWQETMRRLIG